MFYKNCAAHNARLEAGKGFFSARDFYEVIVDNKRNAFSLVDKAESTIAS